MAAFELQCDTNLEHGWNTTGGAGLKCPDCGGEPTKDSIELLRATKWELVAASDPADVWYSDGETNLVSPRTGALPSPESLAALQQSRAEIAKAVAEAARKPSTPTSADKPPLR